MELLLDGAKMPALAFFKKFKEIVGTTYEKWLDRESVESEGGGEWYHDQDENFLVGGTAYSPPKLFKKSCQKKNKENAVEQPATKQGVSTVK